MKPNPDGDNQGGTVTEPGEESGDDNTGGEVVKPNPDGDNQGGTVTEPGEEGGEGNTGGEVVEPDPDKDNQGGTVTEPGEESGDGNTGSEVVEPDPDKDNQGGTVTEPVEPGGDDNTGGEVVKPNPDGDNQGGAVTEPVEPGGDDNTGGEVVEPDPDKDNQGGTVTEPVEPGGDGESSGETTVDPVEPDKDNESGTTNPDYNEKPAYDKEFNASINVFEPKYYYGRTLLKSEDERNAYDLMMQTFITFAVNDSNANDKRIKVDFAANNIHITPEQLNTIGGYILYDEQRLTYLITSSVPKGTASGSAGATSVDSAGYVTQAYYDVFAYNMTAARNLYNTQSALIEEGAQNILSKLKDDMTEGQKFRTLHDEFLKTVSYGQQGVGVRDIRGGLGTSKKILCEGYARTLTYLCQRAGLEVIYVVGTANYSGTGSSGNGGDFDHAWIKVKIDGQWYNVDPTNNDGMTAGSDSVFYTNFLQEDYEFNKTHTAGKTTNEKNPVTSYPEFPESAPTPYPLDMTDYTK